MNWVQFFEDHKIEYVTRSPNVKKGNINIRCPWCGEDDPSEHMGISLTKEAYGCWRSPNHSGKRPHRLVQALLGCSHTQAAIVVAQYEAPDPDTLEQAMAALTGTSEPPKAVKGQPHPVMPTDFRHIKPKGLTMGFWYYLQARGFDDVADLCFHYDLKCALTGNWKGRIIIPFYQKGELIGWTGRAITDPVHAPRYLSSSNAVKQCVFNEDTLFDGGRLLFIVEGPFDALKLDYYGEPSGARATCVFGTSMSIDQLATLSRLRRRFKKVVILFDNDAVEPAFYASDWLHASNVVIGQLPNGLKDPGELSPEEVEQLVDVYRS